MLFNRYKSKLLILKDIHLLALDFDGVITDNRVLVNQDGRESVWCHRGDGWGISQLKKAGIKVIVLSTETNPVVSIRCQKLGVECVQGSKDKKESLERILEENSIKPQAVAYLGNDINDSGCMEYVGIAIAVSDAVPEILKIAHLTTSCNGGFGAVREVADWILAARGEK